MAFNLFKSKKVEVIENEPVEESPSSLGSLPIKYPQQTPLPSFQHPNGSQMPQGAQDGMGVRPGFMGTAQGGVNPHVLGFFAANSVFQGYYACSIQATNWLVDKVCLTPARAAVRNGYSLGKELDPIRYKTDKHYRVKENMVELIHLGRVYGGRAVLFLIDAASEEAKDDWYKNPFNIDGVQPGTYKGMSQIDPNWMQPVLTDINLNDPTSPDFYKPTYWKIGNKLVHHSHLHFFIPHPVPDYLKPSYRYMGIPTPQRIAERVYAAERSANEAPQLLTTKRLTTMQVSSDALTSWEKLESTMQSWAEFRDNYGVKVHGEGEAVNQFDTSMDGVDTTIMTQYQLVSAASNIPVTKLLGTTPKGFDATGESEMKDYIEELEGIQYNDLSPLLERHYTLVQKNQGQEPKDVEVQWMSCDSPTSKEIAELEDKEASRDEKLHRIGAITKQDVRKRLVNDKDSGYYGIDEDITDGQ